MQDKITIYIRIDNSSFERVEDFKYLGKTLMNQNSILEEIKSREVRKCLLSYGAESCFQFAIQKYKINIYKTIILSVVFYGCATWSLTPGEEHRLRVFENRVMRRIFGPTRDEVTGEWRKLYNEELSDLYTSSNIVWMIKPRRMRWVEHVACMGEWRGLYRVLGGNVREKRPLGRPRHRWEHNIKMDLQEVGWWGGQLLAQEKDRWHARVNAVMNY
jgi:hypothetical protein